MTYEEITYRKILEECRETGELLPFQKKDYTKEKVVQQITLLLDGGYDEEELLWMLEPDEVLYRGIYRWNRPTVSMAIVATPTTMALIMGEYELAQQLCEKHSVKLKDEWAKELYQWSDSSCIGGGEYNFGEAWLLSDDMSKECKRYFCEKLRPSLEEMEALGESGKKLFGDFQFHRSGNQLMIDKRRPLWAVGEVREISEEVVPYILTQAVEYALDIGLDTECEYLWKELFECFSDHNHLSIVMQAIHAWFYNLCSASNMPPRQEQRLLNALEVYFVYADFLDMDQYVEAYVLQRIFTPVYLTGKRKKYLEQYLQTVKRFEGLSDPTWDEGMYEVLEKGDDSLIKQCLQNHFLKVERVTDYIDHFLEHDRRRVRPYVVPRLIRLKWMAEEE